MTYAIDFVERAGDLFLRYAPRDGDSEWVRKKLDSGSITIKGTFHFTRNDLVYESPPDGIPIGGYDVEDEPTEADYWELPGLETFVFRVATREGDYFRFSDGVLGIDSELLIHHRFPLSQADFVAERRTSIFRRIAELRPSRIVIGGDEPDAIPEAVFSDLVEKLPSGYELKRYVLARVSSVVREYLDTDVDAEAMFKDYVNRRLNKRAKDILPFFREYEVRKYRFLYEKLVRMLTEEDGYSEAAWQQEILQIILLLNPKYIKAIPEAKVKDVLGVMRRVDLLLVDASGNVDIVEIKKPFGKSAVSKTAYRDNHIPTRELSGSVMQIEKYVFYLSKWGQEGEDALTDRYAALLPPEFKIKITNPGGMVIMGRDNMLSPAQKLDFEVIRRKYKNLIDIVTYDDLLRRLEFVLRQLEAE